MFSPTIREHIPLEQGLRLLKSTLSTKNCNYQRAYSIRTRIKTVGDFLSEFVNVIREHIPLEQGLRLKAFCMLAIFSLNQRAYSIRTRIKTARFIWLPYFSANQRAYSIRTRIKTFCYQDKKPFVVHIREHIPLEQGLRHGVIIKYNLCA